MTLRIPCSLCGAAILPSTAESNNGLCMPCKGGYRKNIDESKAAAQQQKEYQETPEFKHWSWIVDHVYKSAEGFTSLSHPNKLLFASNLVSHEVYNGGFDQYFFNSSSDYYRFAVEGLTEMKATESLRLLILAKQIIFDQLNVPSNTEERRRILLKRDTNLQEKQDFALDLLDKEFWKDTDNLREIMNNFAQLHDLYNNFKS